MFGILWKPPQPQQNLAVTTSKNLHSQKFFLAVSTSKSFFFLLWKSDNLILAVENVRTPQEDINV